MSKTSELVPQGPRGIAYGKASLIPASSAPRFLWGDEKAGYVSDWIYGSSPKIHMMSFEMDVGSRFGNDGAHRCGFRPGVRYGAIQCHRLFPPGW